MDYLQQGVYFKIMNVIRYVRIFGIARTIVKVRRQYHFREKLGFDGGRWMNRACTDVTFTINATLRDVSQDQRKGVDTYADYLVKYHEMLRYDRYLAEGFPIATGIIEGACRHLVKNRMDITGARWGLRSAEGVLKLRSLHSSGDTEAYWAFHKAQKEERNHRSRMASHLFGEAA